MYVTRFSFAVCHILMSFCFTLIYFHLNSNAKWLQGAHKNAIMHSLKKLIANNFNSRQKQKAIRMRANAHY